MLKCDGNDLAIRIKVLELSKSTERERALGKKIIESVQLNTLHDHACHY